MINCAGFDINSGTQSFVLILMLAVVHNSCAGFDMKSAILSFVLILMFAVVNIQLCWF